jgi:hypothetical protein
LLINQQLLLVLDLQQRLIQLIVLLVRPLRQQEFEFLVWQRQHHQLVLIHHLKFFAILKFKQAYFDYD